MNYKIKVSFFLLVVNLCFSVPIYATELNLNPTSAIAQFNLGAHYEEINDHTEACYWYKKSADQGNADAQTRLGLIYFVGIGIAPDYTQAVYWFQKAAIQGNADAQTGLGAMYQNGIGVVQSDKQALYWFQKSANQGTIETQTALGSMYQLGFGVAQDDKQAAYWFQKAADQGDQYAIDALEVLKEKK